jgi:hypothetical protein
MPNAKFLKNTLVCLSLASLGACSPMQVTQIPANQQQMAPLADESTQVVWLLESDNDLTENEQHDLTHLMQKELSSLGQTMGSDWQIRAAFRRIETVKPWLNWASTVLLIMPVDRGGVAVDFFVREVSSGTLRVVPFAQWTPRTELSSQFSRLGPARTGIRQAVEHLRRTLLDPAILPTS